MFDWNEDELADIIWGDANESDDHIVPYPKESEGNTLYAFGGLSKKKSSQEASAIVNSAEYKSSEDKNGLLGSKLENNSCFNTDDELSAPRLDLDSWPTDITGQDSTGDKVPSDFPDVTNLDAIKDKESGRFLDCSWANIGNFDDLDRIFRSDDSMLGNEMVGNADKLWSSSADIIASPMQSCPMAASFPSTDIKRLRTSSEQVEVETEFKPFKSQPLVPDRKKMNEDGGQQIKSLEEKTEDSSETTAEPATSQSQVPRESGGIHRHLGDKVNREKKLLKCRRKTDEKSKAIAFQNMYGTWFPSSNQIQQFRNLKMHASTSSVPQTIPSSVLCRRTQLGGPDYLRYLHTSDPFMHLSYGYPTHHPPIMPMIPIHSERDHSQLVIAGYNYSPDSPKLANPPKKLSDATSGPSKMTPQEKIEKLRRRQQLQAMLAIQRQQQKLRHQVACTGHSVNHKFSQENQVNDALPSSAEVDENVVKFPSLELNLTEEQDDANKISTSNDECTLEETIFNQLQDVVWKVEIKTRFCIRDSLFRLARSVTQRHNICDTSSSNKSNKDEDEVIGSDETNSRFTCLQDTETDTNPVDRTVAHLLFHSPTEPCGRPAKDGIPESLISGDPERLRVQPKIEDCLSPPVQCLSGSLTNKQSNSHQECQAQLACISVDLQCEN